MCTGSSQNPTSLFAWQTFGLLLYQPDWAIHRRTSINRLIQNKVPFGHTGTSLLILDRHDNTISARHVKPHTFSCQRDTGIKQTSTHRIDHSVCLCFRPTHSFLQCLFTQPIHHITGSRIHHLLVYMAYRQTESCFRQLHPIGCIYLWEEPNFSHRKAIIHGLRFPFRIGQCGP